MANGINARMKELRRELNLSQDEFAAKLGFTRGVIANIELNRTEPKPKFVDLVCRVFKVDPCWLETGVGEMFHEPSLAEEVADYAGKILGDKDADLQRRIIALMARIPPDTWHVLEEKAREVFGPTEGEEGQD